MRIRTVAVTALLVAVVACGEEATGPTDVQGTYTLASVNGKDVPVSVFAGKIGPDDVEYRVMRGSLTLEEGGYQLTITSLTLLNGTAQPEQTSTELGSYVVEGRQVRLNADENITHLASATDSSVVIVLNAPTIGTATLVFEKMEQLQTPP